MRAPATTPVAAYPSTAGARKFAGDERYPTTGTVTHGRIAVGDLPQRIRDAISVDVAGGCWNWTRARSNGYGRIHIRGAQWQAHRLVYELLRGAIPDGHGLDHLCRNRACVNPAHLEPVTQQVNCLRSPVCVSGVNAAKTHCVHGHPFDEENTALINLGRRTWRRCLTCRRQANARRRLRLRAVRGETNASPAHLPGERGRGVLSEKG